MEEWEWIQWILLSLVCNAIGAFVIIKLLMFLGRKFGD
jgi:hypothetical protein